MYHWQTLTLARAERLLFRDDCRHGDEAAILASVRDFLYRIGQRHFPEPDVSPESRTHISTKAARTLGLSWLVDGRELIAEFSPGEAGYSLRHPDGVMEGGGLDPADCAAEIREMAHWLLFGERPPKVIGSAHATPRPGEPLANMYPAAARSVAP